MTDSDFITEFKKLIQSDEHIIPESLLANIKGYDSLEKLLLMAYLNDEFKIKITAQELTSLKTINDILKRINHAA